MIHIPTRCPSCEGTLVRVKDQLFCKSLNCEATSIQKIANYCKKRKIKGLAEKSIEKLGIETVAQLYYLTEPELVDILGKNGSKIYLEIEKSRTTTLAELIGSLSIPLVGRATAKKISGDFLYEIYYGKLPAKARKNFETWYASEEADTLIKIGFNIIQDKEEQTDKGVLVITGKFEGYTQATLKEYAESLGYAVASSVSKKTTLLLADKAGSTKYKKADAFGINIINNVIDL